MNKVFLSVLALVLMFVSEAQAVITMPDAAAIAAEVAPVLVFGAAIIVVLLGFLGYRKAVKTTNKS